MHPQAIMLILRAHPSITELIILDNANANQYCTLLTQPVASRLSAIHFEAPSSPTGYGLYVKMLNARRVRAPEPALKAATLLVLSMEQVPDHTSLYEFQTLRTDGLELSLLAGVRATLQADRWLCKRLWI
ncbi:hypothetical protein FB45DRAFT_1070971 [Roridomyces roridus]|uniref:Uncharacterized protein n=1 Tax=Roridomyces roridus TaxID=1738132 RepID=A0AAD7F7W2_9AGAR|nr:hypothetical protein FB45DRAFT_1070971 [Roridomyces roridus]